MTRQTPQQQLFVRIYYNIVHCFKHNLLLDRAPKSFDLHACLDYNM